MDIIIFSRLFRQTLHAIWASSFGVKLYGFDSGQSQTMKGTCCNLLEDLILCSSIILLYRLLYDFYTLRILTPQKLLF